MKKKDINDLITKTQNEQTQKTLTDKIKQLQKEQEAKEKKLKKQIDFSPLKAFFAEQKKYWKKK
jgi:hypothetical protein